MTLDGSAKENPMTAKTPETVTAAQLSRMPRTAGHCAYCGRNTMVYALSEFTCGKCLTVEG